MEFFYWHLPNWQWRWGCRWGLRDRGWYGDRDVLRRGWMGMDSNDAGMDGWMGCGVKSSRHSCLLPTIDCIDWRRSEARTHAARLICLWYVKCRCNLAVVWLVLASNTDTRKWPTTCRCRRRFWRCSLYCWTRLHSSSRSWRTVRSGRTSSPDCSTRSRAVVWPRSTATSSPWRTSM